MRTFHVKNFERFQHYKDRSPPWIKFYNETLDDYQFGCLQDASKAHLMQIWLLASRSNNQLPYDPDWIARRINATSDVDLDVLVDAGFIVPDQALQGAEHDASKSLAECLPREREEGEGEKEGETDTRRSRAERIPAGDFEEWYKAYPRHEGKGAARTKYAAARKKVSKQTLLDGAKRSAKEYAGREKKHIPHPATWLHQERWDDEYAKEQPFPKADRDVDPNWAGVEID